MRCPECSHNNITAFDFCESCLAIMPGSTWTPPVDGGALAFAFGEERILESLRATAPTAPQEERDLRSFPWNPDDEDLDPFIGRDRELAGMSTAFQKVIREWSGQLVLLLGDRGLGTSTVVSRFRDRACGIEKDLLWLEAHCRDEATRPYAVFGRMLRAHFGVPPQFDDWMAGESFLAEVAELYTPEEESTANEMAWLVGFLVGFKIEGSPYLSPSDDEVQTLVPRASQGLMRLISKLAFQRPTIVVVDDAHHASAPLIALLDLLTAGMAMVPVMLLVVGRPELRQANPGWQQRDAIELKPLGRVESERTLMGLLLGIEVVPRDLVERVVDKSGGNPYAMRGIVRYLHEMGVITPADGGRRWEVDETSFFDLDIPDTLRGVASARLSTLGQSDRVILQQAAVVGKQFWFGTLVMMQRLAAAEQVWSADGVGKDDRIVELKQMLDSLVFRELLARKRDDSIVGEEVYAFRSELDRQVLYEQCPARTRARTHRMVAHWLELQSPPFVEQNLAVIARHLDIGGDKIGAASYYQRAARRAREAFHNREAVALYEEALRLTGQEQLPSRLSILQRLGRLYTTTGNYDRALSAYREMLRHAWVMRSRAKGAESLQRIGQVLRSTGRYDAARNHLVEALQLFRRVKDDRGIAGTLNDLGQLAWLTGDLDKALVTFDKSKRMRTKLKDPRGLALTLHYIGCVHLERSDYAAAERFLHDALALRRRLREQTGVSMTLNNLGVIYWGRGNPDLALNAWKESLAITQEIGNRPVAAMLMCNLAEAHMAGGDFELAIPYLEEAESILDAAGDRRTLANVLLNAATLAMARGEHTSALLSARRALETAEEIGNLRLQGLARVALGDITAGTSWSVNETPGVDEGLAIMAEGIALLAKANSALDRASAQEQLADALRKLNRLTQSVPLTRDAERFFKEVGIRPPMRTSVPWAAVLESIPEPVLNAESEPESEPESVAPKTESPAAASELSESNVSTSEKLVEGAPEPLLEATDEAAATGAPGKSRKKKRGKKKR